MSLKPLPKRTYDYTEEENTERAAGQYTKWREDTAAAKVPEPKQTFTKKDQDWAFSMLTGPSQRDMAKEGDYERSLNKIVDSLSTQDGKTDDLPSEGGKTDDLPAKGGKGVKGARKKRDVPQLGEQSKKTISPLKVAPSRRRAENTLTAQQKYELQFAAEVGMSVGELDPLSNDPLPDRKSTRLNSSHRSLSRMPSSA